MQHHGKKIRCKARRSIRAHQGLVCADACGTIEGEIDNLGRRMISVAWDNGPLMYVFPDEIKVEEGRAEEAAMAAHGSRQIVSMRSALNGSANGSSEKVT